MKRNATFLFIRNDLASGKVVAGGAIAHALGVMSGLLTSGARVLCATTIAFDGIERLGIHSLLSLSSVSIPKMSWRLECFLANFVHFFQIRPLFRKNNIDYIYQRHTLMSILGVLLSKYARVPLILEVNSLYAELDRKAHIPWIKFSWLSKRLENWSINCARHIVVVSQELCDELVQSGIDPRKILVNPNGVDVNLFDTNTLQKSRERIRKKYSIEGKYVFGFIGVFFPWHGMNIYEQIIPELVQKHPSIHFLFVGDGRLRIELQETLRKNGIAEDHVTFTGLVEQKVGRQYLAACDAYLLPTQPTGTKDGKPSFYGSPTKVFEYMSMAKPSIVSDLGQLTDIISPAHVYNGDTFECLSPKNAVGIRVPFDDTQGFVAACTKLVTAAEEEKEVLGNNARKKVVGNYTWDQHVKRILQFACQKRG